jgi:hypothetical protein
MGPMPRTTALSIEHRMKRYVFRGGGLNGRIKALTKLLSLSQHRTASVSLTQSDLQQIPVLITMSREQFQRSLPLTTNGSNNEEYSSVKSFDSACTNSNVPNAPLQLVSNTT